MADSFRAKMGAWASAVAQGVLSTVAIALLPGAFVTYLIHVQSVWAKPIIIGLAATMMAALIVCAARLVRSLPTEKAIPNTQNIEALVRTWLDNFSFSVKRDPIDAAYFRFQVTTDSQTTFLVGRPKEQYVNYLVCRTDINPSQDELQMLERFGQYQEQQLFLELQLEMARAKVGYSGLGLPPGPFNIFKRIPINENLTEHAFIEMIEGLEAAKNSIAIVFRMKIARVAFEAPSRVQGSIPPVSDAGIPL